MIIKLKNLSIPFHRLGLGAILIGPDELTGEFKFTKF